jgi:hypothetical protein
VQDGHRVAPETFSNFYAREGRVLHCGAVAASAVAMLIAVYPAYKHLGLAGGGQVAALLAIIVRYLLQVMRVRGLRGLKLLRWRRRISAGGMSPSDCPECRSTKVEAGRVVCTCMRKWGISNRMPRFSMKTVASA